MSALRVLICPDKFKDALPAKEACTALAAGVRDAAPEAKIVECPMADGGDGSGELLAAALNAHELHETVLDPLGRPRTARWWRAGHVGIIEMAEASGLALLDESERHPLRTTSFGTGQLLRIANHSQCTKIILCVGGTATVDGGIGCLQALGFELADAAGKRLAQPATGGDLTRVASIQASLALTCQLQILADVDNPLTGPRGAARVFAPQKGASPAEVAHLEAALANWAAVLERPTGRDVCNLAGAGAAGGIAGALHALLGAEIRPGAPEIAGLLDLPQKLRHCDVCFTGEGRLDAQSGSGKVVGTVARLAQEHGVRAIAFVGDGSHQGLPGLSEIVRISPPESPLPDALRATAANLRTSAAAWVRRNPPKPSAAI